MLVHDTIGSMILETTKDLQGLLKMPLEALMTQANAIRQQSQGDHLQLCSILNAKSGRCSEDCKFCAQSAHHCTEIDVYALKSKEAIVQAALDAAEIGSSRFGIVTSGNLLTDEEVDTLAEAMEEIHHHSSIRICGSLGALGTEALSRLAQAGMTRYHHNIETSRRYYAEIVTTHDFEQRVQTVRAAQAVGLEVCSGGIIGLGETWEDRWDMARTLAELDVDSVPVNILSPIPGTPLANMEPITPEDVIRTLCLFRLILPTATLKIAAGREAVLQDKQLQGFLAGANGMIIGGYLTIKGDDLARDFDLIKQIQQAWTD